MKCPIPVPSSVTLLFAVVGLGEVFQHIPRSVVGTPPSPDTYPPLTAVVNVIEDTSLVAITGSVGGFVIKLISFP